MKAAITALSFASAIALCGAAIAAGAMAPKDFVTDAIKGDNSEVMMGQLAQQRGASDGVRDFGRTLVADHSKAKDEMAKLASSMGVAVPAKPKPDAKKEHDKLAKMSGEAFDQEFIKGMVEDHKKDVAAFQQQANANNGEASKLAAMQLPTLKKHLETAEALEKSQTGSARR